jgi:hypothetical protein
VFQESRSIEKIIQGQDCKSNSNRCQRAQVYNAQSVGFTEASEMRREKVPMENRAQNMALCIAEIDKKDYFVRAMTFLPLC